MDASRVHAHLGVERGCVHTQLGVHMDNNNNNTNDNIFNIHTISYNKNNNIYNINNYIKNFKNDYNTNNNIFISIL